MKNTIRNIAAGIILLIVSVSCKDKDLIPKDTMADIYYDIYMTDATISGNWNMKKMADTLKVYEPIFNKYGYTYEDFQKSTDKYLLRPDKFKKIFEATQAKLEKRKIYLETILEADGKRFTEWSLADSLDLFTMEGVHSSNIYRVLKIFFFQPDTTVSVSPVPDTVLTRHIATPLCLFTDSAYRSDSKVRFHEITGIQYDVKKILEAKAEKEKEVEEETGATIRKNNHTGISKDSNVQHRPPVINHNVWNTNPQKQSRKNTK